ncbi:NAD kinase/diacylglycerol kinase-like domain containing protein [Trema orientale]|uniref:NAD kinase/diacylglycerol kinase-like domain containing protein n=1 Tax=Trema orientale TaxID=63057 RepID=A0A2P5F3P7_TREOI|nr:NAD kinase/diacylglycerol kinase-like domain containing protein [Trema orientale]
MERDGDECIPVEKSHPISRIDGEVSGLSSTLLLDHVGEVLLTINSDGLSWKLLESSDNGESICFGIKLLSKVATEIKFSDVYAAESINYGIIHGSSLSSAGRYLLVHKSEMYRFSVHGFQRSKTQPSVWVLAVYTFGHKDIQTCQMWVNRINDAINLEVGRPKNLMVFIHPRSGKGNGCKIWDMVAPIFSHAKVKTKLIVTQRAGEAFDVMASTSNNELNLYDGVVTVGGDGFFNEILNGFLKSRHKASFPLAPSDFVHSIGYNGSSVVHYLNETVTEASHNEDQSPLLSSSRHNDHDPDLLLPNEWFRFGLIPAGSTDAIVMCTTGARDPVTSALHIVLGRKVCLDLAQVVRWKTTPVSKVEPYVRYAASFAGYGFYGDVITESEKLRWMGPKRYDYAGTKVFLRHRSYQAEIAYLEVKSEEKNSTSDSDGSDLVSRVQESSSPSVSERVVCRVNCKVCNTKPIHNHRVGCRSTPYSCPGEMRWLKSKGRYISVGAAIISNRNERAPDGLVADAHLSDGFLHLILIKDCPHAYYLWHLTQLARKGGNPLNFKFVEHHKTPAFTFTSMGNESVWNLDGERLQAHKLSAQVFRGLVNLFATGPEV